MTSLRPARTEPPWVRRLLVGAALAAVAVLLVLPLALVFAEALKDGVAAYLAALAEPDALAALKLTALAALLLGLSLVLLFAASRLQARSAEAGA